MVPVPLGGLEVRRYTTRPGSATGSERSSTAFITLKTAVFAPIPSASVNIETSVKPGVFLSLRIANLRSSTIAGMAASSGIQLKDSKSTSWAKLPSASRPLSRALIEASPTRPRRYSAKLNTTVQIRTITEHASLHYLVSPRPYRNLAPNSEPPHGRLTPDLRDALC